MKVERIDMIVACILVLLIGASVWTAYHSSYIATIILMIFALWAALILGGRMAAPFYLEGYIIKLIRRHHGRMTVEQIKIKSHYPYGELNLLLQRLEQRKDIEIHGEIVQINEENIQKGWKNFLMRRGMQ